MPLRVVEGGKYEKPILVCDHCGKVIATASDGNYQWRFDGRGDYPGAAVHFTHKKCCHAFEQANPGPWGAMELDCLFVYLSNSLNLDWEAAQTRARILDSI
ncbi:MAG: hypothetical protein ACHRXM_25365 [Isosphaerales bacterium]